LLKKSLPDDFFVGISYTNINEYGQSVTLKSCQRSAFSVKIFNQTDG